MYPPVSAPAGNMFGNVPGYEGTVAGGGKRDHFTITCCCNQPPKLPPDTPSFVNVVLFVVLVPPNGTLLPREVDQLISEQTHPVFFFCFLHFHIVKRRQLVFVLVRTRSPPALISFLILSGSFIWYNRTRRCFETRGTAHCYLQTCFWVCFLFFGGRLWLLRIMEPNINGTAAAWQRFYTPATEPTLSQLSNYCRRPLKSPLWSKRCFVAYWIGWSQSTYAE